VLGEHLEQEMVDPHVPPARGGVQDEAIGGFSPGAGVVLPIRPLSGNDQFSHVVLADGARESRKIGRPQKPTNTISGRDFARTAW
jgi:hypothetical protein